ncbi:MAG: hypothetical protein WAL63_06265, partial [Solirubrobacteraceae bacterium]
MKLTLRSVSVPLSAPLHSAHGTVSERELVLAALEGAGGLTGWGEAAPLQSYDGTSAAAVLTAVEDCRPVLEGSDEDAPIADVVARCAEVTLLPQALAAIDLALWDLAARRARVPAWRLLGAPEARPVPV